MKEAPVSLRGTAIKYGMITAAICIVYFLVMRLAGFVNIPVLRFFNYAFLALGLVLAFQEVTHRIHKHRIDYLQGLGLGFLIALITAIVFSIFIFIYSYFIDLNFLTIVKPNLPSYNGDLNPYIIGVFIFGESIIFGVVLNFIIMQFYKRNLGADNEVEEEAEEHRHHSASKI